MKTKKKFIIEKISEKDEITYYIDSVRGIYIFSKDVYSANLYNSLISAQKQITKIQEDKIDYNLKIKEVKTKIMI